MTVTINKC